MLGLIPETSISSCKESRHPRLSSSSPPVIRHVDNSPLRRLDDPVKNLRDLVCKDAYVVVRLIEGREQLDDGRELLRVLAFVKSIDDDQRDLPFFVERREAGERRPEYLELFSG